MIKKKWYIFNNENKPLCWTKDDGTEPCLCFDTAKDAYIFLAHSFTDKEFEDLLVSVRSAIYFYDGGHLNASGYIPYNDGEELISYKII